jgi:hypothetical protein
MDINSTIAELSLALNSVTNVGAEMAASEEMYQASFIVGMPFLVTGLDSYESRQVLNTTRQLMADKLGIAMPEESFYSNDYDGDDEDEECDDSDFDYYEKEAYYEAIAAIELPTITKTTMVIALCNYKGEGKGYALYESVKHMPIFNGR